MQLRSEFLRRKGCSVDTAMTGNEAISYIKTAPTPYDCILLDVMLSETTGFSLCQKVKQLTDAPVIFLSSLTDDESQIEGFLCGGVDYITKSAGFALFWTKVETWIKLSKTQSEVLDFRCFKLNLSLRKLFVEEEEIILTSLEFDILSELVQKPNKIFSVQEIYTHVWGDEMLDRGQTVQVRVSHMRRKIEKAFPHHYFIETVWGKGYKFIPMPDDLVY